MIEGTPHGWPFGDPNYYPARLLLPEEGCGYSHAAINTIVGGGAPAKLGAYPWLALVGEYNDIHEEPNFFCSGSIITKRHILTSARCIRDSIKIVRLGEHDGSAESETNHIDIKVVRMVKHPSYIKKERRNDLAILTLERDIPFTSKNLIFLCSVIDQ